MEYTREQKLAFTSDRHLVISANAGSGKTRILVDRFLQILEHSGNFEDNPESIIAITFTKKAASEMFARIIKSLGEMINQETDSEKRYRFRRIRARIFQAKVSTIHSFCSSLLRDYAVEADISPNFQELSDTDKYLLYRDAKYNAIEDVLVDETNSLSNVFRSYLSRNTMFQLEEIIQILMANRYEYIKSKEQFSLPNYNPIYDSNNFSLIISIFSRYIKATKLLLDALTSIDRSGVKPRDESKLDKIDELVKEIQPRFAEIANNFENNPIDSLIRIKEALKLTEKIGNSYWYNLGLKYASVNSHDAELINDMLTFYKNDIETLSNDDINTNFLELQKAIYHFMDRLFFFADEEKEGKGLLDFDDLMLLTKNLLSNPEIRNMVMRKVKHLMVDEFQDTNQLQYDIIKDLIPELKVENIESHPDYRLFIVGDGKQSIYAFRNADVRVFNAASAKIAQLNGQHMGNGSLSTDMINFKGERLDFINDENNGKLSLNASFRLSPVVAAFVNKVCGAIMDTSISEFEVDYEDLVFAKNSTAIKEEILTRFPFYNFDEPNQIFEANDEKLGSVSFVIHKVEKSEEELTEDDEQTSEKLEAIKLVQYIKSRIAGNNPYPIFENDGFRDAQYKDVGILIRSRSKLVELMNACIEEKVPFVLHAGSGLYQMQEVQDLITLLKFLYNPNDDIACIGTLRSPFFEISDKELYHISQESKNDNFYQKCKKFSKNDNNTENFTEAFKYLEDILSVAGRLSPSELINKLMYDRAYLEKLSEDKAFDQIKASIEKFRAHIRTFEEKGFSDIYDLMQEMNLLQEIGKEGEASISSDNAINIMTIHASKGLEFPIVALFGTNNKSDNNSSVYFTKNFGISFQDKVLNETRGLMEAEQNIYHLINKEITNQAETAEAKRLLYVALTRAKDHLIISANMQATSKNTINLKSFSKSIFNVILEEKIADYSPTTLCSTIMVDNLSQTNITKQSISFLESNNLHNMLIAYHMPFIYEVDQLPEEKSDIDDAIDFEEIEEAAFIPARYHNEVFSASKIMTYKTDQHDYELKYLVGLNTQHKYYNSDNEKEDDELSGNILGNYIHEAMAQLNVWWQNSTVNKATLEQIICRMLRKRNSYSEEYLEQIFSKCTQIVKTDYIGLHADLLKNAQFELEINIPLEIHYLTGSIDCLVNDSNGDFVIWDWKTNRVSEYKDIETLAEHYKHQMAIYAYLIYLMNKNQQTYKARLLFTDYAERSSNDNWVYALEWSKEEVIAIGDDLYQTVDELSRKYY